MPESERAGVGNGHAGQLNAALARAAAHCHTQYLGRGPSKALAFFRHDVVVILMYGGLTTAEHSLVDAGSGVAVQEMRRKLQGAMRQSVTGEVERLTGSKVTAFMHDTHMAPDMAAQIFVLDQPVSTVPSA
jgi:uncharacterized protein YbcI